MLDHVGDDPKGLRDRPPDPGFASACRRSELAALRGDHVAEVDAGLILTIERSKTDQEAEGAEVAVPRGTRRPGPGPIPLGPGPLFTSYIAFV